MGDSPDCSSLFVAPSIQDHIQGGLNATVVLVLYGDYKCSQSADLYRLIKVIQQQLSVSFGRKPNMDTQIYIKVEGQNTPFTLPGDEWRWQSLEKQKESDFPLIVIVDSKRYELYSDGIFALGREVNAMKSRHFGIGNPASNGEII